MTRMRVAFKALSDHIPEHEGKNCPEIAQDRELQRERDRS
jgi:hypothetical protein